MKTRDPKSEPKSTVAARRPGAGQSALPPAYGLQTVDEPVIQRKKKDEDDRKKKKLLPGLQTKLYVGAPDDPLEREADRAAEKVINMPDPADRSRPLSSQLSTLPADHGGAEVSPALESRLQASQGSGAPLPQPTLSFMEQAFGTDFSDVRIHADSEAARMSEALNARAFTLGQNVYFNASEFQPETTGGRRLLGHELGHVVQGGDFVADHPSSLLKQMSPVLEKRHTLPVSSDKEFQQTLSGDEINRIVNFILRFHEICDQWTKYQNEKGLITDYFKKVKDAYYDEDKINVNKNVNVKRMLIQKLIYDRTRGDNFIGCIEDMYWDHMDNGFTENVQIVEKLLGIHINPDSKPKHPYRLKIIGEMSFQGGAYGGQGGLGVVHFSIEKWDKQMKQILWLQDFNMVYDNLGIGLGVKAPVSPVSFKPTLSSPNDFLRACSMSKEASNRTTSNGDFFYTRVDWHPEDFLHSTVDILKGPSMEAGIVEYESKVRVAFTNERLGDISFDSNQPWSTGIVGANLMLGEALRGEINTGFMDTAYYCDAPKREKSAEFSAPSFETKHYFGVGQFTLDEYASFNITEWLEDIRVMDSLSSPLSILEIKGHASPFWASATSYDEMERNNEYLSEKRAIEVMNLVKRKFKEKTDHDIKAKISVSGMGISEYVQLHRFEKPQSHTKFEEEYSYYQRVDILLNKELVVRVVFD